MQQTAHFRRSIWDYLFYLCWSVLAIWFILKVFGIINTPIWLEYWVPLGSFLLGFLMLYQSIMDKIIVLSNSDARMEIRLGHLETGLDHIKKDVEFLKQK
ncbi:hypothetical protein HY485_05210 [Candidatus Woesearchaeota archaeon]|nr:hypothetical protein [Candidatus Woesearchaeota archaeon]